MSDTRAVTKNGGRRLNAGGGYLVGQLNPQLHFPPPAETRQEGHANKALDAIVRLLNLLDTMVDAKEITNWQRAKIRSALNEGA